VILEEKHKEKKKDLPPEKEKKIGLEKTISRGTESP